MVTCQTVANYSFPIEQSYKVGARAACPPEAPVTDGSQGDRQEFDNEKAIGLKPDHALAWYNKACAYSMMEEKGKARLKKPGI